MNKKLSRINVAVTRPSIYSRPLERAISAQDGVPVMLPGLEIVEIDNGKVDKSLDLLEASHYIFVSRSAARIGGKTLLSQSHSISKSRVYAIGEGTKRELLNLGFRSVSVPCTGQDSEALLELPDLKNISGDKLVVVRGNGGRLVLDEGLRRRGGIVKNFECYHRQVPTWDSKLMGLVNDNLIGAWLATSGEIIKNIFEMKGLTAHNFLRDAPWFVTHPRLAVAAMEEYKIRKVFVSAPGDDGLIKGLSCWF